MSITIDCSVSLSKKLRPLVDERGSVTLVVHNIVGGKGVGKLSLTSETNYEVDPNELGETSIMLTPVAIAEEIPGNTDFSISSLFSTVDNDADANANVDVPVISRLAATKPPENRSDMSEAVAAVTTPAAFKEVDVPACREYVENLQDLAEAISTARQKAPIELDLSGLNDRQKALRLEEVERSESIDVPAWIVNDKAATLSVNDLGITLALNAPYDLSNISAKRIAESVDLKSMLKAGYVRFISPDKIGQYVQKAKDSEETVPMLDVFDSTDQAFGNMEGTDSRVSLTQTLIDEDNAMMVGEAEARAPTEEEELISLTGISQQRTGVQRTVHGSGVMPARTAAGEQEEVPEGVTAIRRATS